jgi:purine-binding chemotaxis protein CheW
MNVRGQVIPVIDQAHRFNGTPVAGAKPRVIVVRIGELTAGFIVDAVLQVVQPPADALRDAPDLGSDGMRVFDRVATLEGDDSLVLIVSPQELLDRAERDLLLALGKKAAKSKP